MILLHPKGDERGSGVDWKARIYRAVPNEHGAWWQRGGFDQAVAQSEYVLLRKSLGHDQEGIATAGGEKIGIFRISSVTSNEIEFSFQLVERIADVE